MLSIIGISSYENDNSRSSSSRFTVTSRGSSCSSSLLSSSLYSDEATNVSFRSATEKIKTGSRVVQVSHSCMRTFLAHQGPVYSLCATQNQLFSGSQDNQIFLWQKDRNEAEFNMNQVYKIAKGDGCVKALIQVAYKDKKLVFSAHQDKKIRVWKRRTESESYKLQATLPTLKNMARVCILPNSYVKVRRHRTSLRVRHHDTVSSLARSWDGKLVFSCSWDRTVKVWRVSDLRCLDSFRAHDDAINAVAASPDGYLYTGSADSTIKVWQKPIGTKKFQLVTTLHEQNSLVGPIEEKGESGVTKHYKGGAAVNALVLSADGGLLYSGMSDSRILVWERLEQEDSNRAHMRLVEDLRGHTLAILCISKAGDFLCSGSADKTIRIWREEQNRHCCLGVLRGHMGPVKSVTVVASAVESEDVDEQVFNVYSGGLDKQIKVWRVCLSTASSVSSPELEDDCRQHILEYTG